MRARACLMRVLITMVAMLFTVLSYGKDSEGLSEHGLRLHLRWAGDPSGSGVDHRLGVAMD